jgi:hypothetical protein
MKVMDKTGEEYAEAMIRAEKASTRSFENSPVNYMPDIPTVIRVWGTLPDYEKWREKQEENQRRQILYRMYPTWKVNLVLTRWSAVVRSDTAESASRHASAGSGDR